MQQFCVLPKQGDKHRKGLKYKMGRRSVDKLPRLSDLKKTAWYKNLVATMQRATPESIAQGKEWYKDAHNFAKSLSYLYKVDIEVAAQVIAALSPAAKWERNKEDAEAIIKAYYHRGYIGAKSVTCSTYGPNKLKALEILAGRMRLTEKQGLKTNSFWRNIADPWNTIPVTIDRHALKVLEGDKERGAVTIKPHQYQKAALVYRTLASEMKLIPNQLQAIAWMQRQHELKVK